MRKAAQGSLPRAALVVAPRHLTRTRIAHRRRRRDLDRPRPARLRRLRRGVAARLPAGPPEALPATEIDPAYADPIPACREMATPAGPVDALFVNRHGALTGVECKLWRNP